MKKILRFSLMALFAVLGTSAMAEDIIWSEDFSSYVADDVPSGGTYSYECADNGTNITKIYEANLAGGVSPELLVGMSEGSFEATVALGSKSGDMYLAFKCNKNITVTVTGGTLGEATVTSNDYVYPITGASGTLTITFKNTLSQNARLDNIKLYQGTAKKPAGLSWRKSSASVTLGNADESYQYIPTLQNPNSLSVNCTSTDTGVATVSSAGVVTVAGAGKTTITASFAGNSEYEAAEVSFELTVKEPAGEATVTEVTVAEALTVINGLADKATTSDEYKVTGYVVGTPDFQRKTDNSLYGNVNLTIADAAGGSPTLTIFRGKSFDNKSFTEDEVTANIIKEGDKVVFQGKLQKYVKEETVTPEMTSCYLISVNGSTGINAITVDDANAPAYSLDGRRVDANYHGVVIKAGKKTIQK